MLPAFRGLQSKAVENLFSHPRGSGPTVRCLLATRGEKEPERLQWILY